MGTAVTLARRGTSNGNTSGSAADRRARRAYLVATYGWPAADDRPGLVCCYRCGVVLLQDEDPDAPGQSVTVDRIVPGCEGGRYTRGNIRPACGPCNSETGGAIGGRRSAVARDPQPAMTGAPNPDHSRRAGADTEQTRGPRAVRLPRTHDVLTPTGESAGHTIHESSHASHDAGAVTFPSPPRGGRVPCPVR